MAANVRLGGYNPVALNSELADIGVPRERLDSWKEIAAYLGRSERTVRRWEDKEGLPVHRLHHDKRGSVYAFAAELDAWRDSRSQLLDAAGPDVPVPAAVAGRRTPWMVIASLVVVSTGAAGFWLANRPEGSARRVPNPEAVRAVQRATFGANAGRTQIQTAIRYYQDAIRLDPMYATAWTGLATAHFALTWFGEDPAAETMATAKMEAQEALRLDNSSAGALRILAFATHYLDWDHATAETYFRRASELGPDNAVVLSWYGDFLTNLRRFDEARVYYRRAQDASPRWLEPATFAANIHALMGNPDLAIAEYRRALESEPNFGFGNHFLGRAYLMKADYVRGIEQLQKSNELLGRVPFSLGDLGYGLAISGDHAAAGRLLSDLTARRAHGYYPAFPFAQIHLGLGDVDGALDWLDRAADERHMGFYFPSADPIYESLRSHPRFRALMQRLNLAAF
jgi:Tfp pilus assembly protein PilF